MRYLTEKGLPWQGEIRGAVSGSERRQTKRMGMRALGFNARVLPALGVCAETELPAGAQIRHRSRCDLLGQIHGCALCPVRSLLG